MNKLAVVSLWPKNVITQILQSLYNFISILDGVIPFSFNSNERLFLRNFVNCTPGTSGGRLARWLQPESFIDVDQCEVHINSDDLKCKFWFLQTLEFQNFFLLYLATFLNGNNSFFIVLIWLVLMIKLLFVVVKCS